MSVTCAIAGQRGKLTCQSHGLFLMLPNLLCKLDTMVLIWETTKSQNCEHQDSQTLRLYCIFIAKHHNVNYKLHKCVWLPFLLNH